MILTEADVERFHTKHEDKQVDECWNWQGPMYQNGYGQFSVRSKDTNRKTWSAHRISWMIHHNQEIPKGLMVCHTCDNRRCVNPNHLYLGTGFDNNRDTVKRGRANRKIGEDCSWSKLTESDVIYILSSNEKQRVLAKKFNVHPSLVCQIKSGKRWKHLRQNIA